MTLTVPKAGSDGGTAARIRVEAPDTGDQIARFGETMRQAGDALEADYLSREAQRFQTDLTGDMNDLHLEIAQIGDPDDAEALWRERTTQLRQSYLNGRRDNGAPRVSRGNAEKFGLVFDSLHHRVAASLGQRTFQGRITAHVKNLDDYGEVLASSWAAGDPDTRRVVEDDFFTAVDDRVASGILTREAAEATKDIWLARAENFAAAQEEDDAARPEFSSAEETVADTVSGRIVQDDTARELARIVDYVPASPQDVERMQARLDQLDALPEGERQAWLQSLARSEAQGRRRKLPVPTFSAGPVQDIGALRLAAQRLAAAYRAGRIDRAGYVREALLIQKYEATFHE